MTGAAKNAGRKPELEGRINEKAALAVDARPAAVTTIGCSDWISPCGGGGAITVSSVGLAFSTSAGCPAKVTAFWLGSGRKPRPRSTTRSPIAPRLGSTSTKSGSRPR